MTLHRIQLLNLNSNCKIRPNSKKNLLQMIIVRTTDLFLLLTRLRFLIHHQLLRFQIEQTMNINIFQTFSFLFSQNLIRLVIQLIVIWSSDGYLPKIISHFLQFIHIAVLFIQLAHVSHDHLTIPTVCWLHHVIFIAHQAYLFYQR